MRPLQQAKTNSFFGQSLFIFLIRFFPVLATVLVTIIYARSLSVDVNGRYISFWVQLPLLSAVACLGIHQFMFTYTPSILLGLYKKIKTQQFILYAVWLAAAGLVMAYMQQRSGYAGFVVSFLFVIVYALSTILESFLLICRSVRTVALINLLYAIAFAYVHVYALDAALPFDKLFLILLIFCAVRLLVYVFSVMGQLRYINPEESAELTLADYRSQWRHMAIYDVSQLTFKWIDKIAVTLLLSAAVSAIYFNGTYDIPFLPLLLSAVGSAALIDLAANKTDSAYTAQLMQYSARILSALVFPLFFFLLFFRYEIFSVVLTNKYEASVPIFLATLLVVPLRAYNFTTVLQNRHKGRIINIGALLDLLLACALMYPMYLLWGLPGLALAFTCTTYLQAAYYLYHTAKVLKVPMLSLLPLGNWLIKLIVFASIFIVFHYLLSLYFSPVNVLILGGGLMCVLALITLRIEIIKHGHGQDTLK